MNAGIRMFESAAVWRGRINRPKGFIRSLLNILISKSWLRVEVQFHRKGVTVEVDTYFSSTT